MIHVEMTILYQVKTGKDKESTLEPDSSTTSSTSQKPLEDKPPPTASVSKETTQDEEQQEVRLRIFEVKSHILE